MSFTSENLDIKFWLFSNPNPHLNTQDIKWWQVCLGRFSWVYVIEWTLEINNRTIKNNLLPFSNENQNDTDALINEQTYQSTVIWLRIMNRQVAHIQTMAITSKQCTKFHQNPASRFSVQALTMSRQSPAQSLDNCLSEIWLRAVNSHRQIINTLFQSYCQINMAQLVWDFMPTSKVWELIVIENS